jgi:arylsulfatase
MKGGKTSVNEGGSRVPFFVRWPGKIEAGRDIDALARHFDLLPTFADLAGADISGSTLDGKSLLPLLENPDAPWEKRTMFYHTGRWGNPASKHEKHRRNPGADNNKFRTFAVRDEQWRLTVKNGVERDLMLCDIVRDPGETADVSKQHAEAVKQLLKVYGQWWDVCRPLMINEDADIFQSGRPWLDYLKEQKTKGPIPELVIPGVQTDVRVVSMSAKETKE